MAKAKNLVKAVEKKHQTNRVKTGTISLLGINSKSFLVRARKVKNLAKGMNAKNQGQAIKKPGNQEEAKTGKKEAAKKLPQTGAVASLGTAALGLALTTLGAGFAFRKRQ